MPFGCDAFEGDKVEDLEKPKESVGCNVPLRLVQWKHLFCSALGCSRSLDLETEQEAGLMIGIFESPCMLFVFNWWISPVDSSLML